MHAESINKLDKTQQQMNIEKQQNVVQDHLVNLPLHRDICTN